jgi:hypothetical protein
VRRVLPAALILSRLIVLVMCESVSDVEVRAAATKVSRRGVAANPWPLPISTT